MEIKSLLSKVLLKNEVRVAKKYVMNAAFMDLPKISGTDLFSLFVRRLQMPLYLLLYSFPSFENPFVLGSKTKRKGLEFLFSIQMIILIAKF